MKNSFILSIPEPCHENWNEMTPQEKGRHCNVCAKTVVDFTRKTDREIAKTVKSERNLCGRFKKKQLERPISLPRKRDAFFEMIPPSYAATLLLPIAVMSTQHINAQQTPTHTLEQVPSGINTAIKPQEEIKGRISVNPNTSHTKIIKGIISDDNGPLPAAVVMIEGKNTGTRSDFDGNFEIEVSNNDTLVFSFIGYSSKTLKVAEIATESIHINLHSDMIMGEIIVMGDLKAKPVKFPKS